MNLQIITSYLPFSTYILPLNSESSSKFKFEAKLLFVDEIGFKSVSRVKDAVVLIYSTPCQSEVEFPI